MGTTKIGVKVLMYIEDQISMTTVRVRHRTEYCSRARGNKATHGGIACPGKENHLRCCARVSDSGYGILDGGCPTINVEIMRLFMSEYNFGKIYGELIPHS